MKPHTLTLPLLTSLALLLATSIATGSRQDNNFSQDPTTFIQQMTDI